MRLTASTTSGRAGANVYSGSCLVPVARMAPPNGAAESVAMFFALAAASRPLALATEFSRVYRRGNWMTSNSLHSTASRSGLSVPVATPTDPSRPSDCSLRMPSSAPPGPSTTRMSSSVRGSCTNMSGSCCRFSSRKLRSALARNWSAAKPLPWPNLVAISRSAGGSASGIRRPSVTEGITDSGTLRLPRQHLGVNDAFGALAAQIRGGGIGRVANGGVHRARRAARGMRREDDVRQLVEARVARRLDLAHIQRGAGDLVRDQHLVQGVFVHDGATRSVNEVGRWLHQTEQARIDHVRGLGGGREVECHEIAFGEQLLE